MPYEGAFINNTDMPLTHNYMQPPNTRTINGQKFIESQRFAVRVSLRNDAAERY